MIKRVYKEKDVAIVLSSSDYFSPYCAVCVQSIIDTSSKEFNYDILILQRNISKENILKLERMSAGFDNISIRCVSINEYIQNLHFFVNGERISQETYYGLIVSWILTDYSKVVIMDCDMLVKRDISQLYSVDISDYLGAGVKDVVFEGFLNDVDDDYFEYYESLGIKNPYGAVNGGLILLNSELFKKEYDLAKIEDLINNYRLRIVDQDIFNMLLQDKLLHLDVAWNHMVLSPGYTQDAFDIASEEEKRKFLVAKDNPYIVHYAGDAKPWKNRSVDFSNDFWDTAKSTEFYDTILSRYEALNSNETKKSKILRDVLWRIAPRRTIRRYILDDVYSLIILKSVSKKTVKAIRGRIKERKKRNEK